MTQKSESTNATTSADMNLARKLFCGIPSFPENLPVTFTYADVVHHGFPQGIKVTRQFIDTNIIQTVFSACLDNGLDMSAECLEYRDFPVVEWLIYFKNEGEQRTPILSDVSVIDYAFEGQNPVLTSNNGDFYSHDGYTSTDTALTPGTVFAQAPTDGRSCNEAYPYQRLMFNGFGLNIAIGWPGQWSCGYTGTETGVTFKAGQQLVHTYLNPGETLRTPRITLLAFVGDAVRGINLWRRWFNAHILPRQYGQPLVGKAVCMEQGGGVEFTEATEENQLRGLDNIAKCGLDCNLWWIDAGWYPCYAAPGKREWPLTGTWEADRAHFPSGLSPIGKKCAELGIDLLLWCEPERVRAGTWLAQQHPEWLLKSNTPSRNDMLNLGDPDCHAWLCRHFDTLIKEYGVKCYRQDFNFAPIEYWRDNETDDRAGMVENLYIQGYLAYWDYLLLNNPDLFIDSCASGGRRNDLETLRRAVPLHHTDYGYGNHAINQAFNYTLNSWVPYYRGFMESWDDENGEYSRKQNDPLTAYDNFMVVNSICPSIVIGNPNYLMEKLEILPYLHKMLGIWKEASPLMRQGDFYGLTPNHRDDTRWTVSQFDSPEYEQGMFKVIRNNRCQQDSIKVSPHGFCAKAEYVFENRETGESYCRIGAEINENGLTFAQPMRSGAIWFYRKADPGSAQD